jgi:riboflavin synthase
MFTGIIETIGKISRLTQEDGNIHIEIESEIASALKVDQSVAHNGICLTVISCNAQSYVVTAINETVSKTNLGSWKVADRINLERGMKLGDRLDGHIVQGHVDQIGTCVHIEDADGSWVYTFEYDESFGNLTIEKGSITINGVSLTVISSSANTFSVAIIPFTFENTNFKDIKPSTKVNLEFDVVGKYVKRLTQAY